jgi:hypothetical protein
MIYAPDLPTQTRAPWRFRRCLPHVYDYEVHEGVNAPSDGAMVY